MYGLVQSGIISHEVIKEHILLYRYAPSETTPVLWTYQEQDLNFTLVVQKLGIK